MTYFMTFTLAFSMGQAFYVQGQMTIVGKGLFSTVICHVSGLTPMSEITFNEIMVIDLIQGL